MMRFLSLLAMLGVSALASAGDVERVHVDIKSVTDSSDLRPVDGVTSSGQPTAEQLALVKEAGYVAVIDLRGESEDRGMDEAQVLADLELEYAQLPISNADAVNADNAAKLDLLLSQYDGPVFLHCGSGNRVGALLALRKNQAGADAEAAIAYGKSAGLTSLEPVVRSRLAADE